jgi:hypothetical protein
MHSILNEKLLASAFSYTAYRQHIDQLLAEGKTTGADQSASMIDYTRMNVQRMKRIDKLGTIQDELAALLKNWHRPFYWLVITEAWCGDAAQNIPYLVKMIALEPGSELKLVLRDEHPELMDAFLTNGSRSIPKLILLDKNSLEVLGSWGPRPEEAHRMYLDLLKAGTEKATAALELHSWYAKNKGVAMQQEILQLLITNRH